MQYDQRHVVSPYIYSVLCELEKKRDTPKENSLQGPHRKEMKIILNDATAKKTVSEISDAEV